MPNTKILKENGQEFYPVTHASLIVGMENQGRMDATYAWDGTGTPDITKIPAGVVVTYDGTSYTGTLAASADTAGRFYLVPSTTVTGEYDRYLTDATGSTITWKPAGTTAIPTPSILDNVTSTDTDKALSANQGKLLKDDLSQLEAKVDDLNTIKDAYFELNDLLANAKPTKVNAYMNDSGVEVNFNGIEYYTIPLPVGSYLFLRPSVSGTISAVSYIVLFADIDGNIIRAWDTNYTQLEWNIDEIPTGATQIFININTSYRGNLQVCTRFPFPTSNKTDKNNTGEDMFVNDGASHCRDYITNSGVVTRSTTIRITRPYKVIEGEIYSVAGYSTASVLPSSLSYKVIKFNNNMGFVGVDNPTTDPYEYTIPSGVAYVSFMIITAALPTLSIRRTGIAPSVPKLLAGAVERNSAWQGKIWVGLGDSLTAQQYEGLSWSPYVENALGLVFENCGIGSTCLAGNASQAFWKRLSAVEAYNPDVVTILGGANDLYSDIPIGTDSEFSATLADKDCSNFKGAYSYIIETLLTWKPSVRLVLMTPSYAHNDGADHTPGIGLTYKDYADATIRVAEYYCLPVVDLYRNMGINKLTQGSTYTRGDKIHWNSAASLIAASLVIAKLNDIYNV